MADEIIEIDVDLPSDPDDETALLEAAGGDADRTVWGTGSACGANQRSCGVRACDHLYSCRGNAMRAHSSMGPTTDIGDVDGCAGKQPTYRVADLSNPTQIIEANHSAGRDYAAPLQLNENR